MSAPPQDDQVKFSLRVVMNKEKTKVLFAEADSDFTDVLLSFLTLPLGTIMKLIAEIYEPQAPVIGSLNSLYKGLENLEETYFWTACAKRMLLNPRNEHQNECRKLKLNLDGTEPIRYFICEDWECSRGTKQHANVSIYNDALKCICGKHSLNREISLSGPSTSQSSSSGVFTQGTASFLISDDLQVKPNVTTSSLEFSGILVSEMLMGSMRKLWFLVSKRSGRGPAHEITSFHDSINRPHFSQNQKTIRFVRGVVPTSDGESSSSIWLQKHGCESRNQPTKSCWLKQRMILLIVFGLLRIPLGRVIFLLGPENNCFASIHNLYNTVSNLEVGKHLKSDDSKNCLLKPQLPPEYPSENQIFSLIERQTPVLYCYSSSSGHRYTGRLMHSVCQAYGSGACIPVRFTDLNGKDSYVKGHLVVTPSSSMSSLSFLAKLKIEFEDIEEMMFDIGMEEALSILKASITSTSALNNAFMPTSMKQHKQETLPTNLIKVLTK